MAKGQLEIGAMAIIAIGIVLLIILPIGIGGFAVVFKLIGLLNTPVFGNSVPLWVIFVGLVLLLMFLRRSGRSVRIVQT